MLNCEELVRALAASVERNHADALLLSGGLDSSILASILRPHYSVAVAFGPNAPDLSYARRVAGKYSKQHVEVVFDHIRMAELVEEVIQIFKTFDPIEIRNSVVALAGIKQAKNDSYSGVMTGDGGDELFAGYNYLSRYFSDKERLDLELSRLWNVMHFSSRRLGEHVGVEIKTPFLDSEFASFAKSISASEKIAEYDGKKWGKFILRKCFEPALEDLAWRPKLAQEQGAATDNYQRYVEEMISDLVYGSRVRVANEQDGVKIRSKEHLHYYAIFRSYFPPPREDNSDCELRCPECHGCLKQGSRFCRICGAFPVTPIPP